MKSYDFDPDLQQVFSDLYSDIPLTNWRRWLDISSREEYECTALKLSGLSTVDDFFDRMTETTDPKSLSVDVDLLANLLSRSTDEGGHLFVSRMHGLNPVVNIDTGDVVTIESQEGLPIIGGDVLRAGFRLKTEVTISSEVGVPGGIPFVGSYFDLDGIEIKNPRLLVACLSERCNLDKKSSVVVRPDVNNWVMVIPLQDDKCSNAEVQHHLSLCPGGKALGTAIEEKKLQLKQVGENPVESKIPRSELLEKVRKGELPKGVLKRWLLYVVIPPDGKI